MSILSNVEEVVLRLSQDIIVLRELAERVDGQTFTELQLARTEIDRLTRMVKRVMDERDEALERLKALTP
jgi:hypothetical protein